jgi:hypothetical protein
MQNSSRNILNADSSEGVFPRVGYPFFLGSS